jgi:hypothetical protein
MPLTSTLPHAPDTVFFRTYAPGTYFGRKDAPATTVYVPLQLRGKDEGRLSIHDYRVHALGDK